MAERSRSGPIGPVLLRLASVLETPQTLQRATRAELGWLAIIVLAGGALRFWGLGAVGLHGDEDNMALTAMHIVRHGLPLMPSGMFYPRGDGELYMMAGAVRLFGESEWAFRLPSAIFGILLIPLAYLAGRRFLTAPWNIAFTAAVAFLPAFVEDAQTARMYGFMVTCIAAYTVLLFEWERTGRSALLLAAVAVLVVGIQFHELSVFAAFFTLYPGLVKADARKLLLGVLAFAVIAAGYWLIGRWIASCYPTAQLPGVEGFIAHPKARTLADPLPMPALLLGLCAAAALAGYVARGVQSAAASLMAGVLLCLGLAAELVRYDHVAFLLIAGGVIGAAREGGAVGRRRAAVVGGVATAWLAFQLWQLHAGGIPFRQSIGALTGWPSIWPYFALGEYSPVALVISAAAIALAGFRLAQRRRIPDFLLFFALAVWIPLLMIGVLRWSIPIRYSAAQSFPFLLCAFAAGQWLAAQAGVDEHGKRRGLATALVAGAVCIAVANPVALAHTAGPGYAGRPDRPDHQGAARFIRSQHPGPNDILLAEDVLEQTYYLGHVNYWLLGNVAAADFVHVVNGRVEDYYTGTPLIGTGAALERLIERRDRGTIYIIGSGENQEDGRAFMRGPGIERVLQSLDRDVVYVGRDGLTRVWRIPPPPASAAPIARQLPRRTSAVR